MYLNSQSLDCVVPPELLTLMESRQRKRRRKKELNEYIAATLDSGRDGTVAFKTSRPIPRREDGLIFDVVRHRCVRRRWHLTGWNKYQVISLFSLSFFFLCKQAPYTRRYRRLNVS